MYFTLFIIILLISTGIYYLINLIEKRVFKYEEWQPANNSFNQFLSDIIPILPTIKVNDLKPTKTIKDRYKEKVKRPRSSVRQSPPPSGLRNSHGTREQFIKDISSIKMVYGDSVDSQLYPFISKNMDRMTWNQMCEEIRKMYPDAF